MGSEMCIRDSHSRLQQGLELEQARSGGEVVKAVEAPGVGAFGLHLTLGAGQEEVGGGALPRVALTSISHSRPAGSKLRMS